MVKIISCKCSNKYQDEKYGYGKRVANKTAKKVGTADVYRCTVCLLENTKGKK